MKPAPLPVIPATPRLLWTQFRQRAVPVVMFFALVGVAIFLWSGFFGVQTLSGVADGPRAAVASPHPGWLLELKVHPYQLVNQGDPIAVIEPVDVRMPLDLLQAELQLARLRNEPPVAVQNAMDYERVRLDILRLKAELATAKVNLERGENDTRRSKRLYEEKVLSEDLYDLSAKTRDAVKAEVVEKADAVNQMEKRLEELRALGDPQSGVDDEHLRALLARLQNAQACAASNWGPITLVAPITGMISAINRRAGEYILDGEPIVGIASPWSDRVVTYLRQPYPLDPEVGMKVRLTTRTDTRQQFWASVTHIGAQVEVITNALTFVRQGALVDVGLPVVIDLPRHTRIRPGEILDLWIERRPASPPPNQL